MEIQVLHGPVCTSGGSPAGKSVKYNHSAGPKCQTDKNSQSNVDIYWTNFPPERTFLYGANQPEYGTRQSFKLDNNFILHQCKIQFQVWKLK